MLDEIKDILHQLCIKLVPALVGSYLVILGIMAAGGAYNKTAMITFDYHMAFWARFWDDRFMTWVALFIFVLWSVIFVWSRPRAKGLARLEKLVSEQAVNPLPKQRTHAFVKPHDTTHRHIATSPIVGTLNAREEGSDTAYFTGTVGLRGLYVGMIIVAAGALKEDLKLEIAIRGFNGSNEAIVISEIEGRIRAGVGNMRDYTELPPLALKEIVRSEPYSEFMLVLYQAVTAKLAKQFLAAFGEGSGRHVGLDFRTLTIKAACKGRSKRWARLPLWDGVTLRRRDDIVSSRNTILSAPLIESDSRVFPPSASQTSPEISGD